MLSKPLFQHICKKVIKLTRFEFRKLHLVVSVLSVAIVLSLVAVAVGIGQTNANRVSFILLIF